MKNINSIEGNPADTNLLEVKAAVNAAQAAARSLGGLQPGSRAAMLRAIADRLDSAADDLVNLAAEETNLGEQRLRGELKRTTFQLRLFGRVLDDGRYLGVIIDPPDPQWPSGARSDLRRVLRPLGPVAVFAASNFPFAFSVAGGDTASALAAGCPVVVKAHPGHPRLSRFTYELVLDALSTTETPPGTFGIIYGEPAGRFLILEPGISAASFTGSLRGGRALFELATTRPIPIPFYGEMGSLNPVFVTSNALLARRDTILRGFVESFTLGDGQFCTKPGVLVVPNDAGVEEEVAEMVAGWPRSKLLNDHIQQSYLDQFARLRDHPAVVSLVDGSTDVDGDTAPSLLAATGAEVIANREELLVECFGPVSLIVTYQDDDELLAIADAFEGQLTAGIQGEVGDDILPALLEQLAERAGRLLWNEWPTGVAVTSAMHHGGPYPATTAPLHTSVGTTAIQRFLRPVSYQSVPNYLLPEALRDGNPLGLLRSSATLIVSDLST